MFRKQKRMVSEKIEKGKAWIEITSWLSDVLLGQNQ